MSELRIEKNGFVLYLSGTWMEISNKYGVLEHGDVAVNPADIPEGFAEKKLEKFIRNHALYEKSNPTCIKRVAFDRISGEYIQLQAVLPSEGDCWMVQKFDNELTYMGEIWSGCQYRDEVLDWMRTNFDIEACLMGYVYRSGLGDGTNGGISSERRELYILSKQKGPFEPEDIRECVYIERREVAGEAYINCRPIYFRRHWYMAGGNFLYTSDSRFKEITGSRYPISIHDRYEGR